jgi:hypothetical protein
MGMDDTKFPTEHTIAVTITEEQIHDNLVSAICGGSSYWSCVNVHRHQTGWANYFAATFTVTEISDESKGAIQGKSYKLSIPKLRKGLSVLAKKYPHHFCDILGSTGDAKTGDALVQCALFGDLVYG